MKDYYEYYTKCIERALCTVDTSILENVYQKLETVLCLGFPVFTFGNGGSAAIADHIVSDLTKCVAHDTCLNPVVKSLVSNAPLLTCIANDYGYKYTFSKQLEWYNQPGALVIGISSSGNSDNIIEAFYTAKRLKMRTVALVGFDGGSVLKETLADYILHVNAHNYGTIEDAHIIILHSIVQKLRLNNKKEAHDCKL